MRRRLVLLAAATTTMVALAFLVPLALLVRSVANERALSGARQVATSLAPALAVADDRAVTLALQTVTASSDAPITVFLADGRTIGVPHEDDASVAKARTGEALTEDEPEGLALYTPVLDAAGDTVVVRVLIPHDELREGVTESWAVLAGLGLLLVAGAVLVADRLGRSIVQPTREISSAARALAGGDRTARAPVEGPPELADVAAALNGLADRIDSLLAAEREAAADLSHRLRTPMTALRLDVDAIADRDARRRVMDDLDELERAVDRLIREARRPPGATPAVSDLAERARSRCRFWSVLAEEEGRGWSTVLPEGPVPVKLPADDLDAVLDALIGNVIAHTPAGTGFSVGVAVDGAQATLVVEDEGPGWPDRDVLTRGESGGGSTGLGLDIVHRAVGQAGGRLDLARSATGGARVLVTLPRADGALNPLLSPR